MVKEVQAKDFTYGGKYYDTMVNVLKQFFFNLNDQIEYIMANCTVLVFTLAKINNLPLPANSMPNANQLHTRVANGWKATKYKEGMVLQPNDIVEWSCNHVAYVKELGTNPQVYASWWTNYDGTSKGKRGARLTKTLKDTVEYLFTRYDKRFFHQTSFEDECARGGGNAKPTYVIHTDNYSYPNVPSVPRDETKNQVYISTNEQRARINPNEDIIGLSEVGYYNVLQIKKVDYDWYEVEKGVWFAGVSGRVSYIPKTEIEIIKDKDTSKKILSKINKLAKEIVELSNE